jgi:hypothetical protein
VLAIDQWFGGEVECPSGAAIEDGRDGGGDVVGVDELGR